MVAAFDDPVHRHRPDRALQIYQILIGLAHNRQTITYGGLSDVLGFTGAGVFSQTLGLIMRWCSQNKLPPLTALVVGKERGTPGNGLTTTVNTDADREDVYAYPWYHILPPALEDLRALQSS